MVRVRISLRAGLGLGLGSRVRVGGQPQEDLRRLLHDSAERERRLALDVDGEVLYARRGIDRRELGLRTRGRAASEHGAGTRHGRSGGRRRPRARVRVAVSWRGAFSWRAREKPPDKRGS
eukprot:scaffold107544_cov70-Phaeocystis_antarctica.AAC.1